MELVAHQREIMKGQGVALPPELTRRCSELRERQELLTVQVAAERQLPAMVSSGTQVSEQISSHRVHLVVYLHSTTKNKINILR